MDREAPASDLVRWACQDQETSMGAAGPQYFHEQAARARRFAGAIAAPMRRALIGLAEEYEAQAAAAEASASEAPSDSASMHGRPLGTR
jgi:hypothetical protein